jgi:Spy/CpxP family protein refolding chaperone
LAAAVIIPALALAQGPTPQDPDGPGEGGDREMGMHGWGEGGGREMGMHRRGGHGMGLAFLANDPEMRKRLGISDEQAAKIRQQTLDFRKAEIRSRADLQVKRLELHSLLAGDAPDRAAIDRTLQEVGTAQMALAKTAIDFHLAMRSALTPEQREKLRQMRQEFHPRGAGQHGPDGPHGPGGPHGMMRQHGGQGAPPPPAPPAEQ